MYLSVEPPGQNFSEDEYTEKESAFFATDIKQLDIKIIKRKPPLFQESLLID